jgi:leader peptidase (prepilin peptidase) / N-methyltransferase
MLAPVLYGWIFVIGLCIGSFLNVVIARLPAGESIVRPRSKCPKCGRQLTWYENIPVISWLALRGRCKGCGAPISVRYLLVELGTGLLFMGCVWRFGWDWPLVPALMFVTLLVPLILIDAETWQLPLELTLPGMVLGVLLQIPLGWAAVKTSLIGLVAGFLVFRLMEFLGWLAFRKEALGGGDKFLLAVCGAFLGWQSLLAIVFLSSLHGSVVGLLRIGLTGRAGPKSEPAGEDAASGAEEPEPAPPTMSWDFLQPGLSFGRRLWLLPWSLLLQSIPDEPKDTSGEEIEWQPDATNLPYGPWIGLAALELLLFSEWLATHLPLTGLQWILGH